MPDESKAPLMLDDRRRLKSLWAELLFARIPAVFLAAMLSGNADLLYLGWPNLMGVAFFAFSAAIPSMVVKRGWFVLPLAAAGAAGAGLLVVAVHNVVPMDRDLQGRAVLVAVFAAVGVVEGQLERSIATTMCGLMGGALSGALANEWWRWRPRWPWDSGPVRWSSIDDYLYFYPRIVMVLAIAHLGLGLSLALGRWVRDIPKRAAARSQSP
jgi:hypothetical protein